MGSTPSKLPIESETQKEISTRNELHTPSSQANIHSGSSHGCHADVGESVSSGQAMFASVNVGDSVNNFSKSTTLYANLCLN